MFQGESNPHSEVSQSTDAPPNNEEEEAVCISSDCQSNQSESSADSRGRLSLLETELQARTRDLDRLKFKIDKMKSHQMSSPAASRRETKPINIKIEVERLRKDKKVMAELLKQSQQELTRKDSINRKLKMENDKITRNMAALQGKIAENGRTQNLLEELNRVRNELSVLTNKTDRLAPYQGQTSDKDDKGRYIEELVIEKEQLKQCLSAIYFKITPYAVSLPSRSATPPVWTEDVKNTFDQFWEEKVKLQRELEELRERVKSREASAEQNRTSPECYETTVSDCSTDSKSDYLSDATIVKVSRPTGHHDLESEVCRWKEMYQNVYDKYRSSQHTISYHEKKFKKIYSAMDELVNRVYGEENVSEGVSGYNITKVIQKLSEEYTQLKESIKKIKHEEQHQTDLQNSILEAEKTLEEKGRNARTLRNAIGTLQLTSNMETKVASLAETMLLIYNNQLNWLKQLEHNNTLPNSEGEETHSNSPNQCDIDLPIQDDDKVDNRLNCGDASSCSSESNESSTCEAREVVHKTGVSDLNVKCSPDNSETIQNLNSENGVELVQEDEKCKNQEIEDEVKIENAEVASEENKESHAEEKEIKSNETMESVEDKGEKNNTEDVEEETGQKENLDNSINTEQEISSEVQTETTAEDKILNDLENESSQNEQVSEANEAEDEKGTEDNEVSKESETNVDQEPEKDIAEEKEEEEENKEKESEETKSENKDSKDEDDDDDDEKNSSNANPEENTEDGNDESEKTSKDEENKEESKTEEDVDKTEDTKQVKEEDQTKSLSLEQNENEETTEIDESCGNDENSEITDVTEDKRNTENDIEKETNDAEDSETDSKTESEQHIEINEEEEEKEETITDPESSKDIRSKPEGQDDEENNESNVTENLEETNEGGTCSEEAAVDINSLNNADKIAIDEENLKDKINTAEDENNDDEKLQNHVVQSVIAEVHNNADTQEYITDKASSEIEHEYDSEKVSTITELKEENKEGDDIKDSIEDNEEMSETNDQSENVTNTAEGSDLNIPDSNQHADDVIDDTEENTSVSCKSIQGEDGDHETIQQAPVEEGDKPTIIIEAVQTNAEESSCSSESHSISANEDKDNIKIIVNPASSEENESASEEIAQSSANDGQENADEVENTSEKTEDQSESIDKDEDPAKDETELTPVVEEEITKVVIKPKKNVLFSTVNALEKDGADTVHEDASKQDSDDSLNKRIEELETEMSEMLEVKRHHMKVACDLAEKLEAMKKREIDLQDQLSNAETKTSQEVEGLWKEWSGREQSYQDEIAAWKENVEQQNSVLQRLKADLDQAQQMAQLKEDEIAQLRSIEKEKQPDTLLERETQTSDQEEDQNSKELQETVDRLRMTSEHYQQQLMENRTVVREVKSIIEGSVAQLVTLKAMGTKHMKREYVYRNNLAQKELDLKHLQSELDKQSIDARAKANIIEKQRNEIRSLREELRKCQKDISAKVEFIDELQSKMQNLISSQSKPNSSNPEDLEIYTIGRRCIEEQHTIHLEKQKQELERMRQELHILELKCSDIDSAAESSDQQNLSHPGSAGSVGSISEDLPTGSNLCLCKRKDVNKILKLSEESYLNLLASLVVCLGIQDMKYNKSLQRLSWSQCKDISAERKANQKRIMKIIQDLKKEERTVSPRLHHPERSRSTGETEKRRGLVKCISPQNGRSMYISDMIKQAEESLDKDKPAKSEGRKPASWRPHTSMNDRRIPLELKNGEILALLGNAEPKSVPKPALSSK